MLKEFKTLLPYIKRYWLRYALGLLCLVTVDAAQLLLPQYLRRAVDTVAAGGGRQAVLGIGAAMVATAALVALGRFMWRYFIHGASRRIETHLRDRLFGTLMVLPMTFFGKNAVGDLMARATNDMQAIRMATGMAFVSFVDGVFMSMAILVVMFAQSPATTGWTIIPLPLVTVLIIFFGKLVGARFKRVQEIYSDVSSVAQETLQGIRVVKSFVKEKHFAERFSEANDRYRDASMRLVKVFGFFFPLITFLGGLSTLVLIAVGGTAVLENRMSPGLLAAMLAYLEMLLWPMLGAGFTVNMIQRGAASLKRVNAILDHDQEPRFADGAAPKPDAVPAGDVEFRDLTIRYADDARPALDSVSIRVPRGAILGILGRVGSGKSTLLKTLARIVEPPRDSVLVGGTDVGSFDLERLRSALGFVPQDSFLFSDSIRNNVLFANPDLPKERFLEVVKASALDRDLEAFPKGWDTVVGERGLTLSGGQKQRVAIARALAADPEILVLDDALSAVDTETEERILGAVLAARAGRTTLIVSNRVSTLKRASLVAVLDGGRLIQLGSPAELASEDGFYAEIAAMQALSATTAGAGQE
ncbi:MAG: ABC transporter ATP-binding protein [Spirochaetia bacterium]|nr:ABC transporter ATP-binding protein [Spirochaetia bacterium]